tara:strand:- start:418 stop:612 length:195 start_codon:yes stop_codon:yes gene_type:complete
MSNKYEELYVNVLDIKFYVCDEEGNELTNPDGSIKEFYCKGRLKPLEYLCEDMTIEDLVESKSE